MDTVGVIEGSRWTKKKKRKQPKEKLQTGKHGVGIEDQFLIELQMKTMTEGLWSIGFNKRAQALRSFQDTLLLNAFRNRKPESVRNKN